MSKLQKTILKAANMEAGGYRILEHDRSSSTYRSNLPFCYVNQADSEYSGQPAIWKLTLKRDGTSVETILRHAE
jgi:hypothetical protein